MLIGDWDRRGGTAQLASPLIDVAGNRAARTAESFRAGIRVQTVNRSSVPSRYSGNLIVGLSHPDGGLSEEPGDPRAILPRNVRKPNRRVFGIPGYDGFRGG